MITASDVLDAAFDEMGGPFGWEGQSDCSATACAAWRRLTGIDLMAGLRGLYASRAEAMALIRSRGGFTSMWRLQAASWGLIGGREVTGAIGVIRVEGADYLVLGLCMRPGLWVAKSRTGAAVRPATVEVCWNA
ncbi:DUF6950 family protein [Salipiger thiooxidans]|uniref:DUF6950 family protein n=1 Tax=Salipiger thiooxidans TaxID=282683 RepID=UPI001CD35A6A|nr:hypothetical protein [Salipiger thiooxidans]MCA0848344.1 hypothetical protein [Salipiger thiooxidans]